MRNCCRSPSAVSKRRGSTAPQRRFSAESGDEALRGTAYYAVKSGGLSYCVRR